MIFEWHPKSCAASSPAVQFRLPNPESRARAESHYTEETIRDRLQSIADDPLAQRERTYLHGLLSRLSAQG